MWIAAIICPQGGVWGDQQHPLFILGAPSICPKLIELWSWDLVTWSVALTTLVTHYTVWPCDTKIEYYCCRTPCLESAADRLETLAFDCFIREQTEEFSVSCCLHRERCVNSGMRHRSDCGKRTYATVTKKWSKLNCLYRFGSCSFFSCAMVCKVCLCRHAVRCPSRSCIVTKPLLIRPQLLWDANRKPYPGFRLVQFSITLNDP